MKIIYMESFCCDLSTTTHFYTIMLAKTELPHMSHRYVIWITALLLFLIIIYLKQGNAQRPEVRIVTWNNDELSTDALPVHGFEHYKAKDYSLAHAPFSG